MPLVSLSDWDVEFLRLTAFTNEAVPSAAIEWWKESTGIEPASTASKPGLNVFSAEGQYQDMTFALNIGPGRVDWLAGPIPTSDTIMPSMGDFVAASGKFLSVLQPWLSVPPLNVSRIAYGVTVKLPTLDKIDAYTKIAALLPALTIDPVGSRDLNYSINRPRQSSVVNELRINRLSKWSVVTLTLLTPASTLIPQKTFCRLELDINTDLESTGPFAGVAAEIVNEMNAFSTEILEHGDVA